MFIHDRLGVVVLVLAAGGALVALLSLARPHLLPALRVYLRLLLVAVVLQVGIGLVLVATGERPALLHWVYGAAALAALPLAMLVGSRLGEREEHLWIAGGAVAVLLLAFRAVTTG